MVFGGCFVCVFMYLTSCLFVCDWVVGWGSAVYIFV